MNSPRESGAPISDTPVPEHASPDRFSPDRPSLRRAAFSSTAFLVAIAAFAFALHLVGINRYGFFRDELYYLACGRHLAWGYIDQPPLIALVAWLSMHLFGSSLAATRLFPALAAAVIVFLTGIFARDLGGGRFAQALAAAAILFAPLYLAFDSFLSMNAFEPIFWILCAWIALRIVQGASPRLWLVFGAVAGVGIENKHTMLVLGFALVVGLVLAGRARLLASPWPWLGAGIALALFLPNLLWEAAHHWPQVEVVRNAQEFKNAAISPFEFLFEQVLFFEPLALPLWLGGLAWLFIGRAGKSYRFLAWAYVVILIVFISLHGKSYYPAAFYPILMAAGAVAFERIFVAAREPRIDRRGRRAVAIAYPALIVVAGLLIAPFGTPLLPLHAFVKYSSLIPIASEVKTERDSVAPLPQLYADMIGWPEIAQSVARDYHSLPLAEQPSCAILAGNYGEAGAIDLFGPALGLPAAISGHNNYFLWGPRDYSGDCVIIVGERSAEFTQYFGEVHPLPEIHSPLAMPSEQHVSVYLCRKPVATLTQLWPHFKMII
ncbi:MAG: glycosyltransferase family 39 protein [Candidatus Acidiferrales bacterium]